MSTSQIPENITSLCGENPELNIFESGKNLSIPKDIRKKEEDFQLFIIYNPFNKGLKKIEPALFNKCISFTLSQIDNSLFDSSVNHL